MFKRIIDIACSLVGLFVFAPVMMAIAVLIRLESAGPIFYRGLRVGLNGKHFRIWKFRTMIQNADQIGPSSTADDDHRITAVGQRLRRYKLDELPQLLNVMFGDMSLVGPRPQVPWAVARYSVDEMAILGVRPGITDYASLHFRNEGEILRGSPDPDRDYMEQIHPMKMQLSLQYVRTHTVAVDIRIIAKTIRTLLRGGQAFAVNSDQSQHTFPSADNSHVRLN